MMKFAAMILVTFGAFAANAACTEGSTTTVKVPEHADSGDYYQWETRTCVNGTYMNDAEKAAYVRNPRKITCQEGTRQAFHEYNTNQDHYELVIRTCVNGSFFPKATNVKKYRCVEGTLSHHSQYNSNQDRNETVVTKCVGGKHIEIRRF